MNHVLIILLVFGAGLACGAWAMWLLVRAGEKRLEQMLSATMDGKVIDQMQRAAERAATVYDSEDEGDKWEMCSTCGRIEQSERPHHYGHNHDYRRVRVTARRVE